MIKGDMHSWWILIAVSLMVLILNLDYTSVNIALVAMAKDVGSDLNEIQWVLSGYVLSWASVIVLAGKLADMLGNRRILLFGIATFLIASIIIAMAGSVEVLIIGRILQGIGGAFFVPSLYSVTFKSFPTQQHGFVIGLIGGAAGIGLAVGPTFSGFLVEYVSWRAIFWANVPLSLVGIAVIYFHLAQDAAEDLVREKIDYLGAIMLGCALPLLILGMNNLQYVGQNVSALAMIMVGVVLIVGFLSHTKKYSSPLIPRSLFANKAFFKGAVLAYMPQQFSFSAILVVMALYLQNNLRYSPKEIGIIFLAITISFGITSIFGGKITDRYGLRFPAIGGLLLTGASAFMLCFIENDTPITIITPILLVAGFGLGFCMSPFNTGMMQAVPSNQVTLASSVFAMASLAAHTVAIVASASIITGLGGYWASHELFEVTSSIELQAPLNALINAADRSDDLYAAFPGVMQEAIRVKVDGAFLMAAKTMFATTGALLMLGAYMAYRHLHIAMSGEETSGAPSMA